MKSLFVAIFFILCNWISGSMAQPTVIEPSNIQNLTEWKDNKNSNARDEKLLACWLYLRQENTKEGEKRFQEHEWLHLMKECIKKISRKDSVLKITQLGKMNKAPVTPFAQIMNTDQQLHKNIQASQLTEFDKFLVQKSEDFTKQLSQILEKGDIGGQIQEELKKRQKYYFGFIPATMVNHTTILITLTVLMMFCCTCCKFYNSQAERSSKKKAQKKQKNTEIEQTSMMRSNDNNRMGKRKKY